MRTSLRKGFLIFSIGFLMLALIRLTACEQVSDIASDLKNTISGESGEVEEDPDAPDRDSTPEVLTVDAPGKSTFKGDGATVDYSNAADGYVMIKYEGKNPKIKVQISFGGGEPYTYNLNTDGHYEAFPLTQGSGKYSIGVFTNISGSQYAQAAKQEITATIANEFSPYLRPNQYVDYVATSQALAKAAELSVGAKTDLGALKRMYDYVTENISYDYEKAKNLSSGYLPDIDETLKTGKGICFDYASLMSAMFRSQGIPTRLVVGYADTAYHAWIDCYVDGQGWIVKIQFDGAKWYFMDPTFTASGDKADPNLIGSGTNYNPMYYY